MQPTSRRHFLGTATLATVTASLPVRAQEEHDHSAATPEATPGTVTNTGTGAAYMTIQNTGQEPDRLVSAVTPASQSIEIHAMSMGGGVMTMKHLPEGLELPPGETVTFDPANLHLMLVNLNQNLDPGSSFDLELVFERAGTINVPVAVQMEAPNDAEPVRAGDLEITGVWARPAPRLTPAATPVA